MGDHPMHKPVVFHPVRLMRAALAHISMELGLPGQIDAVMAIAGVEFVAEVWAHVRMVAFRLPRPPTKFTRNCRPVTADSSGNRGSRVSLLHQFLDFDTVSKQ